MERKRRKKEVKKLKLALPKGSLQKSTIELFSKAGISISSSDRSYFPACDDAELDIMLVRSQEIPVYVQQGVFDLGVTGYDWIMENNASVKEICELVYGKVGFKPVRWVLAVPESSGIKSIKGLNGKRIATEVVNIVNKYLKKNKIKADVEFSWGATEAKAGQLVDAIVELTETGSSLKANKLKVLDEVLSSTTRLIANKKSYDNAWKRNKIENIAILLQGALSAQGMVGIKLNIREANLQKVLKLLPALKNPTVSPLLLDGWVALEVILKEESLKKIIPELKRAGAEGIIEYPLNKLIY